MITIDRHIEILLLDYDCVIVPGLGGFVAHHVSARIDEKDGTFLPPYRTLGFNTQLTMNDSLLAQSYVDTYDWSYPEAQRQIETEVDEINRILETEGKVELNDLGWLSRNDEGKIEFEPFESGILTPSYYGLSGFELSTIAQEMGKHLSSNEDEVKEKKHGIIYIDKDDSKNERISISMQAVRNLTAAAIFLTAVFLVAFPGTTKKGLPEQQVKSAAIYNIFDSSDTPIAVNQFKPVKSSTQLVEKANSQDLGSAQHYWAVVMASHVTEDNARIFVNKLKSRGLKDARVYEGSGSIKVLLGYFKSQEEAVNQMRIINETTGFKDSWIIEIGN